MPLCAGESRYKKEPEIRNRRNTGIAADKNKTVKTGFSLKGCQTKIIGEKYAPVIKSTQDRRRVDLMIGRPVLRSFFIFYKIAPAERTTKA